MKLYRLSYTFIFFVSWGCDISNNNIEPTASFVKIYDDDRFEEEYYPLDVIQTADNGFLILSEKKEDQSLFTAVYILKTDALGNVLSQTEMTAPYAKPVNGWSKIGDNYYFVCMDSNNLTGQLVAVDEAGTVADPILIAGMTYPLVSQQDDNNLVILSFDNTDGETVISVVNTSGQISLQASYNIGAGVDVEKPIIDHLTRNGDQLPFSVGKISGGPYYFNGFYNYTFSLVFTNFGNEPTGVCQGQLSSGGISAVASVGNSAFGVARFNFGDNYLNPIAEIPTNSITSSTDLGGNIFPEMESGAQVKLLKMEQEAKWLYATNTVSKQIVLYGFNQVTGSILSTEYLGSNNPYSFASITLTNDGGIAILAKTALEGRFQRIALFKRDAKYLNGLFSK
jgi:hypothetical protein